jgi:anti-anti-sigma regulatory factor
MKIERIGKTACLVDLPSELTDPDESSFLEACAPGLPSKTPSIILDFSAVQKMNGLGASMLVKLNVKVKKRSQCLRAFGVSTHYQDVLKVTGLDKAISVHGSREDAISAAGSPSGELASGESAQPTARDISSWAKPVSKLIVPPMPPEAINKNMNGLRVVGPVDGFGQLWQKRYRLKVSKSGVTPEDAIQALKQNFPSFQPPYNRFYPTAAGIQPGEVVAIDSSTPGGPVSTGVMVLYADDRSFTFITPQGHPESGWVTFSASEAEGVIIVQILGLARANDPVYEAAFRAIGSSMQVKIWKHVLTSLAKHLDVPPDITVEPTCVDTNMQWSQAGNIWYNAQIRTLLYMPLRWAGKPRSNKTDAK